MIDACTAKSKKYLIGLVSELESMYKFNDYSKKKFTDTCTLHGEFQVTPSAHSSGTSCPAYKKIHLFGNPSKFMQNMKFCFVKNLAQLIKN